MNAYDAMWKEYLKRSGRCNFFGLDIAISAITTAVSFAVAQAASAAAAGGLGSAGVAAGGVGAGSGVSGALSATAGTIAGAGNFASGLLGGTGSALMSGSLTTGQVVGLAAEGAGVAASAATSIYSGYAQARQEKAMGKAQARFAEYNAQVAEAQAATERQSGTAALRDARSRGVDIREKHRYLKAAQQARMAKSGVVAASGTPLLVAQEEAMQGKLRVMDEIWMGKMEKREHDIRASFFDAEAGMSRMQGDFAKKSAKERAKSSILSGWTSAGASLLSYGASSYAKGFGGNEPMSQFGTT